MRTTTAHRGDRSELLAAWRAAVREIEETVEGTPERDRAETTAELREMSYLAGRADSRSTSGWHRGSPRMQGHARRG